MRIRVVMAGYFKLDGGAMFGIVPKVMWQKLNPANDDNLCPWSMRSLLIETETRKILVDTGIGHKQGEKFRSHFYPSGESVVENLHNMGVEKEDITDVFLTHLHFDHCGDATEFNAQGEVVPTFPRATYWSNKKHWEWALEMNDREKASFLVENFVPLQEQGVLKFIETTPEHPVEWLEGIRVRESNGHTRAMMLPDMPYKETRLLFLADLIPSSFHLPLPYVMAYDLWPFRTLEEKAEVLQEALDNNYYLCFQHDPVQACCTLKKNDRGRIVADQISSDLL